MKHKQSGKVMRQAIKQGGVALAQRMSVGGGGHPFLFIRLGTCTGTCKNQEGHRMNANNVVTASMSSIVISKVTPMCSRRRTKLRRIPTQIYM